MKLGLFLFFAFAIGCSTYQGKISESRSLLKDGRTSEAIEKLEPLAEQEGKDQLIYLLDYATALQAAGRYKESNQVFLKADRLAELQDYHSITNVVGATLGGEEAIQYKGESFEKFLINTMLALNFLSLNDPDSALVEARRINEKVIKMKMDGREPYELSPFAKYISALVWESQGQTDDAYIAYEETYKINATNPFLPEDLIRSAKKARRPDTYERWKKEFPQVKESPDWYDRNQGEIIVLLEQGWGPKKVNRDGQYRFPRLQPVPAITDKAEVFINGNSRGVTQTIYDIETAAIQTLEKDYGALVARRIGALGAKAVVADQIRQKNELLGALAWVTMNVSDRADLRQWSTLPKTIQMIRIRVKPGTYKLRYQGVSMSGSVTADQSDDQDIIVKPGRKTFKVFRSLR